MGCVWRGWCVGGVDVMCGVDDVVCGWWVDGVGGMWLF